jgi:dephospho-CoA kinase
MYQGKPIIGLSGGIGAGKTFVGATFAELGCLVISSDELVREAYRQPGLKRILRERWGDAVFGADGAIDRSAVSRMIFADDKDRRWLESMTHPLVAELRDAAMRKGASGGPIVAFVWDSPLLFETSLAKACDATVFVEAPEALRLARVQASRGWDQAELTRREKSQMPLDKKRAMSDYVVVNTTNADSIRVQVRELFSRILAGASRRPQSGQAAPG